MTRKKLYFRSDEADFCHDIETHKDYMRVNGIKELDLFEAKIAKDTGFFFCKEYYEVGESKTSCGTVCPKYKPNNGKNGRCKHYGYVYEQTDNKITLKLD